MVTYGNIMMSKLTSMISAMAKKGKKRGRGKYKNWKIFEDKRSFLGTIRSIFDDFLKVLF